jgi:hypothetical protein
MCKQCPIIKVSIYFIIDLIWELFDMPLYLAFSFHNLAAEPARRCYATLSSSLVKLFRIGFMIGLLSLFLLGL